MQSWCPPASSRRGVEVAASARGPRARSTGAHLHMLDLESIIECKAALIHFYRDLSSEDLHSFKFAAAQTSADLHLRHYRPLLAARIELPARVERVDLAIIHGCGPRAGNHMMLAREQSQISDDKSPIFV